LSCSPLKLLLLLKQIRRNNKLWLKPSMVKSLRVEIKLRLLCVLGELEKQNNMASNYPVDVLPFADQMKQIHEWVEIAGEYEIAYESLVATIEAQPFVLTGKAAISLLELALLLNYKTGRPEDKLFDKR
jgi:hypothetical protein